MLGAAYRWERDRRVQNLLQVMGLELARKHKLSDAQVESLVKGSMNAAIRDIIYSAANKALLAESTLGIRMMAIMSAKHIHDRASFTYDDVQVLRALQELTDDEIIFAKKLAELHSAGQFPADATTPNTPPEQRMVRPNEDFFNLFDFPREQFIPKVEALKKHGILADNPSGFMDTMGGWGYARVCETTRVFAKLAEDASGYSDADIQTEDFDKFCREHGT